MEAQLGSTATALLALGSVMAASVAGGWVAGRLGLPPLVGMLLGGLLIRNSATTLVTELPETWSVQLRLFALAVILLRAGLGLDLDALSRLRGPFLRLSFLPNLAEASAVAAAATALFGLPVAWGLLLGFVVAAVSPAVVVPGLLDLQARGYGVRKGIPTMVLAAASFDDVVAITGFGSAIALIFASDGGSGLVTNLLRAPIEMGVGLLVGIALGLLAAALGRTVGGFRFPTLLVFALSAVLGGWLLGATGGGSLATVTMGAVAQRTWAGDTASVAVRLGQVWSVAQPVLFGLIGAAVLLSAIEPSHVTTGLAILGIGLVVRVMVTYLSVATREFSASERRFVAVAWIPKATVQAAIGGLALDLARERGAGANVELYGSQVLTVAVLAILATAPIGAIAIAQTGPRWLDRS